MRFPSLSKENLALVAIGVVGVILLHSYDPFETLYHFSRAHEEWELDELFVIGPVLLLMLSIYTLRRVSELKRQRRINQEKHEELMEAYDKINNLSQAQEKFISIVFHEIISPLNGVIGALRLMELSDSPDEMRENVLLARSSADSLMQYSKGILDISKMLMGEGETRREEFNVRQLIGDAVAPGQQMGQAKGISVVLEFGEGLPQTIVGDRLAVRHIVQNLVANGVKYTDEGSVVIQCGYKQDEKCALVVTVSDTGKGIPKGMHEMIFAPYKQLDSESFAGIGLGLFIVKRLVDICMGSISLRDNDPHGTVFEVVLPLESAYPAC